MLRRRLPGLIFYLKSKLRRKSHCSHYPQRIFVKPVVRFADASDDALLQILSSTVEIHYACVIIIGHRIYREVTSEKILRKLSRKCHAIRSTMIGILSIDSKCRNLVALIFQHYGNCAVLQPSIHRALKYILHLVRRRRCGDIPVIRLPAEQTISDAAAHRVGLVSRLHQLSYYKPHILRHLNLYTHLKFQSFLYLLSFLH